MLGSPTLQGFAIDLNDDDNDENDNHDDDENVDNVNDDDGNVHNDDDKKNDGDEAKTITPRGQ